MNHLVYIDDRGPCNELHLTLECRRAGVVTRHDVDPDACAAELDNWLRANPGRELTELAITTSRVHHGDFAPVIDVLAAHRPRVSSLMLGALTFPDFDRGNYIPDDPSRDGSSWKLAVPLDQVLKALPNLEDLVVQANSISTWGAKTFTAPRLRHLVIRDDSLDPDVVAALGQSSFRSLEVLEVWLGHYEYSWGGMATDLLPLLNNPELAALRHLTIVSDLGDTVIDAIAESAILPRLATLDLSHGTLSAAGAAKLRDRWSRFAHLRRLCIVGNAIPLEEVAALRDMTRGALVATWQRTWLDGQARFEPPLVSLFDARPRE